MRVKAWVLSLALGLASLVGFMGRSAVAAGPYDPDVSFQTITTPHFLVMYPKGFGQVALRTAQVAEDAYPYLVARYEWEPAGRTSIVLNDQTDFANGSAQIVPSKIVTLYVTAPTRVSGLEEYDDWLSAVLIHELAHIWHLDMAYGLPWIGRLIFGKYIAMNAYTQAWVTEGLAVYEETVSTGAGRGRSSFVDMVVRTAAAADRFPPIDQGYRGYPRWPFSNIAYFFGGRFQLWLREKFGEEKLMAYHRAYAANPIPYFTYLPAKLKFDASLEALWDAWALEMKAEARRDLELVSSSSMAVSEPRRLTDHGGQSLGPRFTPDGKSVVFSTSSGIDGPRLRKLTFGDNGVLTQEVLANDTLSEASSFTNDGKALYFQQTEINQRFYAHNSLLRYELDTGRFGVVRVKSSTAAAGFVASSGSLRARDPDVRGDGQEIVFVQNWYGSNRLVIGELANDGLTLSPRILVAPQPDVQFAGPRFSPDGSYIAVSRFERGRRDIVIYDRQGQLHTVVTRDRAQDTDPTWSPDGETLVFTSDRTGFYNLYAYHLPSRTLRQISNVLTGAFQPSVGADAKTIVYRGYSADGFDVYALPFEPQQGLVVSSALEPIVELDDTIRDWPPKNEGAPPVPPPAAFSRSPLSQDTLPNDWELSEYSALDTILPFNDNWNLFPSLGATEREIFGSLTHIGADARFTHGYVVSGSYGTLTNTWGGVVGYTNDVLEPTFSLVAGADAVTYGARLFLPTDGNTGCPYGGDTITLEFNDGSSTPACRGSRNGNYNERQVSLSASIGLPVLQRHFFSLGYIFERRTSLDEILPDTLVLGTLPRAGNFARVRLGYTYANIRRFPFSISNERGPTFALALSALSKGVGSDYEQLLMTTEGRYYLTMPWTTPGFTNHVLAGRLAIGAGFGPDLAQLFRLGGVSGRSAITTTTPNFYGMRGFAPNALIGPAVISGSVEYRAPLFRVDRGIGTLPFVLRVVHAAIFADFGRVFADTDPSDLVSDWDEFGVGIGAELRADVILFYGLPLTLRAGYAYPVRTPVSLTADDRAAGFYGQIGTTF